MTHLTKQEKNTYNFIRRYIKVKGISPTEKEIAEGIGIISRGVAHRHVTKLYKIGLIDRIPRKRRNIVLTDKNDDDYAALMLYCAMICLRGVNEQT